MTRRFLTIGALTLLLAGCQVVHRDPIKIGYIGPLTGEALSYGIDTINGVRLAVDDVNEEGGIKGRMVELIAKDARCDSAAAEAAARTLIHVENVVAIIGGQCSAETLGAAPIAEAARVPMISPVSSSPKISEAGSFIFRVYPNDDLKTRAMAKYVESNGYTKLAMISEDTAFTSAFRESLQEQLGDGIVYDAVIEPGTRDFDEQMEELKRVNFDVFFPNAQSDVVMAAMMNQLRDAGHFEPAITHDVGDSTTLGNLATAAIEKMHVITVPTAGDRGQFANLYVSKIGIPQQSLPFAAHAYDAAHVMLHAINRAGTNGGDIRDFLRNIDTYHGVVGSFRFDPQGDVVGIPYVLKEFRNGLMMTVAEDIPIE